MEVLVASPWVPAEWIKAHGLEPRGAWLALDQATDTLPLSAGVCAFAESLRRLAEGQPNRAVIFPTHCDQLRRSFDGAVDSPPDRVFQFNLPAVWQSATAIRVFKAELERLQRFLIQWGGRAPSPETLRDLIEQYRKARGILLDAAPLHSPRRMVEAVARFHWDGSVALPRETRRDHGPGSPRPVPLALVGGPLPRSQWTLLEQLERAGGSVVLNATEAGERSLWRHEPRATANEDLLEELARDYADHCVDVFQRPNTRLYCWLAERIAARRARGVILWTFVGCDLWRAEVQSMREAFDLPVLLLDADETAAGTARNAGRIEAFIESLR
jgi:benzoyl-CoA reductase/2-hydroxyglutaryl-CoA dehydratase subunit BcrC/BadD/HgdB